MTTVRGWLETLGLAEYGDAFEKNDIDMDLLPQVDDQMLKDVGVASGGHRLRIRNAIAKLSTASRTAADDGSGASPARATGSAEHRQLCALGQIDGGQEEYTAALAAARRQQATWWELRVAVRLGRLWQERGQLWQVKDVVAPLHARLDEGHGLPEVKQLERLLENIN